MNDLLAIPHNYFIGGENLLTPRVLCGILVSWENSMAKMWYGTPLSGGDATMPRQPRAGETAVDYINSEYTRPGTLPWYLPGLYFLQPPQGVNYLLDRLRSNAAADPQKFMWALYQSGMNPIYDSWGTPVLQQIVSDMIGLGPTTHQAIGFDLATVWSWIHQVQAPGAQFSRVKVVSNDPATPAFPPSQQSAWLTAYMKASAKNAYKDAAIKKAEDAGTLTPEGEAAIERAAEKAGVNQILQSKTAIVDYGTKQITVQQELTKKQLEEGPASWTPVTPTNPLAMFPLAMFGLNAPPWLIPVVGGSLAALVSYGLYRRVRG